jgi:NitT/TauT family transport system ATP-binding protein
VDNVIAQAKIAIEGHAVAKVFTSRGRTNRAVGPLDFRIEPGEFVSIVGPSGCGKSTLMLMVAGLLSPSHGEIRADGRRLEKPLTDVGIVFQDDLLLEFRTAEDNVLLQSDIRGQPRKEARAQARRLLTSLGVGHAGHRYPKQLSGGMRQRVSLARALIHNPSLLLMDEAFGALDAITRTQMRHDLEKLWLERHSTVLFITHSIEEAVGLSDRVIVMSPSPGLIVEQIHIELPRPRPLELGKAPTFVRYTDQIHEVLRGLGVFRD